MTEALIDFPTIEAVPMPAAVTEVLDATPAQAPAETAIALMRRTTLAELSAVERGIAKLKADHGATDYDITTPKGLQLARTIQRKGTTVVMAKKMSRPKTPSSLAVGMR